MSYINPKWKIKCVLCDKEVIGHPVGLKCRLCRRIQPKSSYFHGFIAQDIEHEDKKCSRLISSEIEKQIWQEATPWQERFCEFLCPEGEHEHKEGHAKLYHKGGWTCLAIWDNSVVENGWCVFAFQGKFSYTEIITTISKVFPEIWKRFDFALYLTNKK